MKTRHKVSLACFGGAVLLLAANLVWAMVHTDTPRACLPPVGEALEGRAPLTFAVLGDNRGNQSVFEEILARIKQERVSLVIHTGDIVRDCTGRQYDWILHELSEAGLTVPLCAVPGNHDVLGEGANRYLLYERAFGPRRYWFSCGDTLFVGLGSYGEIRRAEDVAWLDETLGRYRAGFKHCIVFTHVPPRDPRPGKGHALPEDAGAAMVDVLKEHNVTCVFAGHIHSYIEDEIDGVPIYITGGAGAERDEPVGPYHYLLCTIEADGKLDVRKVDVSALPDTDYAEYAFRVKFPVGASFVGAGVLLLGGIFLAKNGFRRQ